MSTALVRRWAAKTPKIPILRSLATHAPQTLPEKDCASITPPYERLQANLQVVRDILNNRPLTLAEKILYSHIYNPKETLADSKLVRGESYLQLSPERVAMQDASAQYVVIYSKLTSFANIRNQNGSVSRTLHDVYNGLSTRLVAGYNS